MERNCMYSKSSCFFFLVIESVGSFCGGISIPYNLQNHSWEILNNVTIFYLWRSERVITHTDFGISKSSTTGRNPLLSNLNEKAPAGESLPELPSETTPATALEQFTFTFTQPPSSRVDVATPLGSFDNFEWLLFQGVSQPSHLRIILPIIFAFSPFCQVSQWEYVKQNLLIEFPFHGERYLKVKAKLCHLAACLLLLGRSRLLLKSQPLTSF